MVSTHYDIDVLGKSDARDKDSTLTPENVVERFLIETQRRAEPHGSQQRRSEKRIHRTWPLVIRISNGKHEMRMSAALYNASSGGIAFLAPLPIPPGTLVQVQLFWHDDECPRVPAIVRHCTVHLQHQLIGCEFLIDTP